MRIEDYRERLAAFTERLNREHCSHFSGRKERLEVRGLYGEYSDLFSPDTIREIRTRIDENPAGQDSRLRSLRKLHAFAVEHHLEWSGIALAEEISEFESRNTVQWNGRPAFLGQIPALLSGETDAARRRQLDLLRAATLDRSNGIRRERIDILKRSARELGFKSYLDACSGSTGIDYASLSTSLQSLLSSTESAFLGRLDESARESLGLGAADLRRCDAGRWARRPDYERFFPRDNLLPAVHSTLRALGIEPDRQTAITLDQEERPRKQARAFCCPIRIPQEIVISLTPLGGYDDYAALLHETGHAQHFAWTDADLAAEHRLCGDRGTSEFYASLFEHLIWNARWLDAHSTVGTGRGFVRFQLLLRAHVVRRYCAKLHYEVLLLGETGLENPERSYAEILKQGTGMEYDPESYLEDLDEWFCTADYLRAWILEAQVRDYLQSRFGTSWFASRAAGNLLKELWETGRLYDVDQLAREIGIGAPDPQVLADELLLGLRK